MKPHTSGAGRIALLFTLFVGAFAPTASAQLFAAKDGPIVYGHHHLNVTNVDAAKKFFVDALGGKLVKVGPNDVVMFPNVFVFLRQQAPTGGSKGSRMSHIGFTVTNLRQTIDRLKAAGYRMTTTENAGSMDVVKDDISFNPIQNHYAAFVMGPDDLNVEVYEIKENPWPISLHHIHHVGPAAEMKEWYVKTFGAKAGARSGFQAADLPGVNLSFSEPREKGPVAGLRGTVLDHIGFEVKNLEAFLKKLEADGVKIDRPYTKNPASGLAIAFIYDPWGTYIELTEGLDKIQ